MQRDFKADLMTQERSQKHLEGCLKQKIITLNLYDTTKIYQDIINQRNR